MAEITTDDERSMTGDTSVSQLVELLARSERRFLALECRQRRLNRGFAVLTALSLLLAASLFSGVSARDTVSVPVSAERDESGVRATRRERLLSQLPAEKRKEVEEFEMQVRWFSEYMQTWKGFEPGAAVALFLSKMAQDMRAMPEMHQEMRVMNAQMRAVPVMAAQMQAINAKIGVMAHDMDSTMGRAGRMMPWMPFAP